MKNAHTIDREEFKTRLKQRLKERKRKEEDREVDQELESSFPASDPPSWTSGKSEPSGNSRGSAKKLVAFVIAALLTAGASAHAATTQTANVTASVTADLALTMAIFELDPVTGNPSGSNVAPNMAFGELVKDGNNAQRSAKAFAVFLSSTSSSRPYVVRAAVPAMANPTNTLPNALLMRVIQATQNGNDIPGDAFNGNAQSGVMTEQTIYTSNSSGSSSDLNLVYGISGGNADGSSPFPGWQPIPPDQPAGNYSTTATYTLVLS